MDVTTETMHLSETTIKNTAPEPSTTAETTTAAPAPLSSYWEDTTNITGPELLMMAKTAVLELSYKATNKATNTDTMPSIGTSKEKGLYLEPGGVTQDPSHYYNSSLSSGPSLSYR